MERKSGSVCWHAQLGAVSTASVSTNGWQQLFRCGGAAGDEGDREEVGVVVGSADQVGGQRSAAFKAEAGEPRTGQLPRELWLCNSQPQRRASRPLLQRPQLRHLQRRYHVQRSDEHVHGDRELQDPILGAAVPRADLLQGAVGGHRARVPALGENNHGAVDRTRHSTRPLGSARPVRGDLRVQTRQRRQNLFPQSGQRHHERAPKIPDALGDGPRARRGRARHAHADVFSESGAFLRISNAVFAPVLVDPLLLGLEEYSGSHHHGSLSHCAKCDKSDSLRRVPLFSYPCFSFRVLYRKREKQWVTFHLLVHTDGTWFLDLKCHHQQPLCFQRSCKLVSPPLPTPCEEEACMVQLYYGSSTQLSGWDFGAAGRGGGCVFPAVR